MIQWERGCRRSIIVAGRFDAEWPTITANIQPYQYCAFAAELAKDSTAGAIENGLQLVAFGEFRNWLNIPKYLERTYLVGGFSSPKSPQEQHLLANWCPNHPKIEHVNASSRVWIIYAVYELNSVPVSSPFESLQWA